jgi:hypothetical protein
MRGRSDDDFAAEVESHIAMETERLVRGGMSPAAAAFEARRAFGNPTVVREQLHDARPAARFEWIAQDVRHGLRSMRRNPAFTAIAVASLAIGIGANTTTFGAIDTLLLRTPAHVVDASRIRRVYFAVPGPGHTGEPFSETGYGTYAALRDHVAAFEAVGAFWKTTVSSGRGADARSVHAVLVTPSVFTMLGVRPALGRFLAADEERDEHGHVAVLGYEAWQSWFGGRSDVLGRAIDVSGTPYVIAGIAPAGFTGVDLDRVDLWLPLGAGRTFMGLSALDPTSSGYWLSIVAKVRDSASLEVAESQATAAYRDRYRGERRFDETFAKSRAMLGPIVAARGPGASGDAKVAVWVGRSRCSCCSSPARTSQISSCCAASRARARSLCDSRSERHAGVSYGRASSRAAYSYSSARCVPSFSLAGRRRRCTPSCCRMHLVLACWTRASSPSRPLSRWEPGSSRRFFRRS